MPHENELARFDFIVSRDGLDAALAFAEQTYKIYRSAVLQSRKRGHTKPSHASLPEYRPEFIRSYLVLKRKALTYNPAVSVLSNYGTTMQSPNN